MMMSIIRTNQSVTEARIVNPTQSDLFHLRGRIILPGLNNGAFYEDGYFTLAIITCL